MLRADAAGGRPENRTGARPPVFLSVFLSRKSGQEAASEGTERFCERRGDGVFIGEDATPRLRTQEEDR